MKQYINWRPMALFASLFAFAVTISGSLLGGNTAAAQDSTLTLSEPQMQIPSRAIRINPEYGAYTVPMMLAAFKAETGDLKVKRIYVEADSLAVNTYYLYNGNTFIAATGVDPTQETFIEANTIMAKDTLLMPTIKVNLREDAQTASPTGAVSIRIKRVTYEKPDGSEGVVQSNIIGRSMYPMESGAIYTLRSAPTITATTHMNGTTSSVIATFSFDMQAFGDTVLMPTPDLYHIRLTDLDGVDQYLMPSIGVVTMPSSDLGDGSVSTVTVTASLTGNAIRKSGLYKARLEQVGWKIGQATTLQTWGLDDAVTGILQINSNDVANTRITDIRANADQTLTITAVIPAFGYLLQHSPDMVNWSNNNPPNTTRTLMSVAPNGMQTFEIRTPMPAGAAKRFFRIAVTPQQ